uniref:tRNA (guanosine(18)-2'-O)-methyltransferase TARBP1 n=1 Tax=Oryza sativa subsp. japonica TaxID=39947 RepID=Q10T58_ORYSJ|nr:RNA methyltransferase, TrmH family protein, expressed [Oryza sativa Japonica Group]
MALAALERCFQAVPTDAVAGIVDCVLASSSWSSPSQLFHALLHSDHAAASSLPHAAALCHLLALLDQERPAEDSVRALLWRVFLPLLRQEDQLQHTIALMCDAVSTNQSFSDLLGATILPLCIRSSAIAMDMDLDSTLLFVYQTGEDPPPPAPGGLLLLPISKATAVLASLLQHTLERNRKSTSLNALLHNLTWDLSSLALNMFGHSQEYRSCATRVLLHPLLLSLADVSCVTVHLELAAAPQLKLSRSGFLESIWASCLSLFALGPAERLDAYNILSLYLSTLKHVILGPDEYDLRNSNDFWDEIRRGLVDKDSLVRKQALYILRISLDIFSSSEDNGAQQCSRRRSAALPAQDKSNTAMTKRERWAQKEAKSLGIGEMSQSDENCSSGKDRWKVFLLLYEMLQEYGTHLVEAAWTHQVMLLFESTPRSDYSNHMSYTVFHAQMESFEGFFHWMVVLWERGFTHDNPQVRYLVMHSFLDITWEHYLVCPQIVPRGFVLGPLLRGLNDVVHHKDFEFEVEILKNTALLHQNYLAIFRADSVPKPKVDCVKGVYDSKIIKGAERFFGLYAQRLTTRDRLHLVWSLSSSAKQDSFGRAGLMALAFCVASCACHLNTNDLPCDSAGQEMAKCNGDAHTKVNIEDLLDALMILCEKSKQHFNPKYRLKVCEQVMKATTSLISAAEIPLNQLLYFISAIPREFTDYYGELRPMVQKWFVEKKECSSGNTLLEKLIDFPTTFVKHTEVNGPYLFDDEDVGAWEAEARRWARTLLLVTSEEQHFTQIFVFLEKYGNNLSEEYPTGECIQVKFFIIVLCLIEELEVKHKRLIHQNNTISKEGSDSSNGLEHHALNKKLAKFLLIILENMVIFSRTSCSIFWLRNSEDMDLPSSVKGKLGGPSQRRLPTSTTSLVLQAIWSMRSISSIVTWCNNYCSDISLCSTLTFFWEFCWEVIQHHSYATEWLCLDSLLSFSCCRGENESLLKMLYPLFSESTLRSIFVDIIESLENAGENSVLAILRCVRSVLGLLHFSMRTRNLSSLGISYEMMMQFVKSSWILHLSCNKRRVAPIAALLSAVLHPAIFPNLEMHQENEKGPGPLKWFIENLLGEGSKSPRTIRLAALHLSGIWLMYPKTLSFYMEELKLLSLYGSVAFDEDFEAELSENHEARLEVSMLAQSPDREFTEVFINTELYARVSVAVLFDHLWKQIEVKSTLETEEALRSGKLFLLKLLDSAVNDKDISRELYKKYSSVHRRKVRIWQMICVLSQYVEDDIVKEVTSSIHICLYRNNLPAVRQYLETFAILIYLKFPALAEEQLIPIFHDNEMRQQALSSYVFIAANLILHSRELAVQINHLNELFPPIMPFLTSHHHSLRGFTQLLVHCVLSKMGSVLALGSSENPVFERRCFQDLKRYLAENTDCVRLRASVERFLDVFNPDTSGTPSGIFSSRPEVSFDFECVPVSVMERVINFLNDVREDLRQSIAKDSITIKNEDLTAEMHHKEDRTDENIVELLEPSQDVLNFQKKITPYRNFDQPLNVGGHSVVGDDYISRLLLDLEGDDQQLDLALESRNHAVETIKQSQQQLIVVASLVDRIPNLAGLTRTCEIFKAVGLAVADKSIIEDKQFRLISVTAEKWLPMMEVPVNSVKVFLEKKRLEGYSVIGLEQTANSKPLDHFSFPSKTVLVLGREKEGIPVDIIHVLDACVEIPQLGIVRSLNVHVSGAIAVWEYTRQQRIAT